MDPNQQPYEPTRNNTPILPPSSGRRAPGIGQVVSKIAQIIWLITVIIVILISIRVVFALIGANAENQLASFVYSASEPFVEPFRGLLQVGQFQVGVSRFEFESVIGIFVYLLAGWGITAAISILKR